MEAQGIEIRTEIRKDTKQNMLKRKEKDMTEGKERGKKGVMTRRNTQDTIKNSCGLYLCGLYIRQLLQRLDSRM
jgi:hypothetical protein